MTGTEVPPMRRLEGRVALITGTSGGQGRAAALRFAQEGAIVVGCGRKQHMSDETVELVRAAGYEMHATVPLNLADPDECKAWIDDAAERFGAVDILYNNASAFEFELISKMTDDQWHNTIKNELDLVFYACRAAWPYLKQSKHGGVIINAASIGGLVATTPGIGTGAHAATKGGVIALTRELASEGAEHGIRVNTISPGFIKVPTNAELVDGMVDVLVAKQMIKRIGVPEDISGAAAFLASDDAAFMTGANLVVDGGTTAGV